MWKSENPRFQKTQKIMSVRNTKYTHAVLEEMHICVMQKTQNSVPYKFKKQGLCFLMLIPFL